MESESESKFLQGKLCYGLVAAVQKLSKLDKICWTDEVHLEQKTYF